MSDALSIVPMRRQDLDVAISWAAAEGWNPGLDDADAFFASDPGGFLMGWVGEDPACAVSVVRHAPDFGFLGFYLCAPSHRGQGHGYAIWRAGMAMLGDCSIGLDGVPDQQANYSQSGFVYAHNTQRYGGPVFGRADPTFQAASAADIPDLLAFDSAAGGVERHTYMAGWYGGAPSRQTLLRRTAGQIDAVGTIRRCGQGHKIGPLIAPDDRTARALILALADEADAREIFIDVPDPNGPGVALMAALGLEPSFACARMYKGHTPARDLNRIFGETTFELG